MSDTVLVRALVGFAGGPKPGATDEIPKALADIAIAAGFAVAVDKLEDRLPKADLSKWGDQGEPAPAGETAGASPEPLTATTIASEKNPSNQSGGSWDDQS